MDDDATDGQWTGTGTWFDYCLLRLAGKPFRVLKMQSSAALFNSHHSVIDCDMDGHRSEPLIMKTLSNV